MLFLVHLEPALFILIHSVGATLVSLGYQKKICGNKFILLIMF